MSVEPEQFALSDPDGTFLVLDRREAQALLDDLQGDDYEDLSPALKALRDQLEEWFA